MAHFCHLLVIYAAFYHPKPVSKSIEFVWCNNCFNIWKSLPMYDNIICLLELRKKIYLQVLWMCWQVDNFKYNLHYKGIRGVQGFFPLFWSYINPHETGAKRDRKQLSWLQSWGCAILKHLNLGQILQKSYWARVVWQWTETQIDSLLKWLLCDLNTIKYCARLQVYKGDSVKIYKPTTVS